MIPRYAHSVARIDEDRATLRCGRVVDWGADQEANSRRQTRPPCPDCLRAITFAHGTEDDMVDVIFG